jgi:thiamine-phosphate diphosphorylase / hydroxyethylthiazole kinase
VDGLQQLLGYLRTSNFNVKTVCIGGINASNAARVLWQSASEDRKLDGIAVVSAIVAAQDPAAASQDLLTLVRAPNPPFAQHAGVTTEALAGRSVEELVWNAVPEAVRRVHERRPLSHNMTNLVVQNIAANVALAVGASPIMANYAEEARDLAALGGALVINMGTVTPEGLENYQKTLRAYNDAGQPVVYDPVG